MCNYNKACWTWLLWFSTQISNKVDAQNLNSVSELSIDALLWGLELIFCRTFRIYAYDQPAQRELGSNFITANNLQQVDSVAIVFESSSLCSSIQSCIDRAGQCSQHTQCKAFVIRAWRCNHMILCRPVKRKFSSQSWLPQIWCRNGPTPLTLYSRP